MVVVTHSLKLEVIIKGDEDSAGGQCPPQLDCLNSLMSRPPSNSQVGANNNTGIIGGCVVKPHSLPWQVGIAHAKDKTDIWCGGSIICPRYVLTAGNCLYTKADEHGRRYKEDDFFVAIGLHDVKKTNKAKYHKIKKFHEHPSYPQQRPNYNNDYTIMELKKSITFNQNAKAIYLPPSNLKVEDGTRLLVSGWGRRSVKVSRCYPEKLNAVNVQMVSNDRCNDAMAEWESITKNMMCAGQGGKDSCAGDGGGPLAWLDPGTDHIVQLGIGSWGPPEECGLSGYFGVYSKVTEGLDWIKSVVGDCNIETCDLGNCMTGDKLDDSVQHLEVKVPPVTLV